MKATKSFWICLAAAATVMLPLPWAMSSLAGPTDLMGLAWLLFFFVDPLCTLAVGIFSGIRIKERWSLPVWCALLYLLGAWLVFSMGETAFFLYAGIYLLLGLLSMLASAGIRKSVTKTRQAGN